MACRPGHRRRPAADVRIREKFGTTTFIRYPDEPARRYGEILVPVDGAAPLRGEDGLPAGHRATAALHRFPGGRPAYERRRGDGAQIQTWRPSLRILRPAQERKKETCGTPRNGNLSGYPLGRLFIGNNLEAPPCGKRMQSLSPRYFISFIILTMHSAITNSEYLRYEIKGGC